MQTRKIYFVNPPHPPLMNLFRMIVLMLSMISTITQAQDIDSTMTAAAAQLPQWRELEMSIKVYHNMKFTAERQEWEIKEKGKVLKYVPDIGFTFGLPSVNLGTGKILTARNQKELIKQKIKNLEFDNALNMNDELGKSKLKHENIINLLSEVYRDKEILKVERDLFGIYQKQYDNKEIPPSEYLSRKKTYLSVIQQFRLRIENIRKEIHLLKLDSHYQMFSEEIYLTAEDCDMLQMRQLKQVTKQ